MKCETSGEVGNNQSGMMVSVNYIDGLSKAILSDTIAPAKDEETDEELRTRFYKSINSVPFGGNIADYQEKVKEISGVGGTKIIPTWNGGGTVKVIIINNDFEPADNTLINNVISKVGNNGTGIAPIGHDVTVVSALNEEINITTTLTLDNNVLVTDVQTAIENAINEYFLELKKSWENSDNLVIRIAHIESRILDVVGVQDVTDTTINGETANLSLLNNQIPILNQLTLNEVVPNA